MAGRHIKDLIAAHRDGDELSFRRAVNAIIEEEEAKKHTALARDLRSLLASTSGGMSMSLGPSLPEGPRDRDSGSSLLTVSPSNLLGLDDLVLDSGVKTQLETLLKEISLWPSLDAAGVPRRNRVLLYGPPGNGKTSIAHAIAGTLDWPVATARIDSLVSSYLGETATNLRSIFDFATGNSAVTLLDEFDTLGKLRNDASDHGELRRVVNATLQMIDRYKGKSLIVAATNSPDVLDSALWRRFDLVIEVPSPTVLQSAALLTRMLGGSVDVNDASRALEGLPFAAAEYVANGVKRRAILAGKKTPEQADIDAVLTEAKGRRWQ
jgi:SpoVK/Ycf46/Vps4 family AAA+-type ATPase